MTTTNGSGAWNDLQQQVLDRAETDPEFRAKLLENPKDALEEQFGIATPANISVRVIEEQPGEVILVLPARHMGSGTMLSDEELERAAGGLSASTCSTACGTCSGQSTCAAACPH
jgi:hypothetical protein